MKKLRENLFDQPKTLVPYSMESIADAWRILDDMYGDWRRCQSHECESTGIEELERKTLMVDIPENKHKICAEVA